MKHLMRESAQKILVILLIVSLNAGALGAIGKTAAMFEDTETSLDNLLAAGSLDFSLTNTSQGAWIGLAEEVEWNSVLTNAGTLGWDYAVSAEKVGGSDAFCNALDFEAKLNGVEKHDDSFSSFMVGTSTTLGTWHFELFLPPDAIGIAHGDTCAVDIVFRGWQENMPAFGDGFYDEERVHVELTARMVVLNEFLPNPHGFEYGFDFGGDDDDMPQGEWVELYNNGTEDIDLAGWYIRDVTDGEGNKTVITVANTAPATTILGGKSWLVVYMNKSIFNNTGDSVRLFDAVGVLIDSYEYSGNDYCDLEPTPGDENETTAGGSCAGVPPNKSYARIPDGIGDWVDPIPTPGGVNKLNNPDVLIAYETNDEPLEEEPQGIAEDNSTSDKESVSVEEAIEENAESSEEEPADGTEEQELPEPVSADEAYEEEIVIIETLPPEENAEDALLLKNTEDVSDALGEQADEPPAVLVAEPAPDDTSDDTPNETHEE